MTYRGRIKNGAIVLDEPVELPEGAEVAVDILPAEATADDGKLPPTLYERMKPVIGIINDLPPDASLNHDHYLYGRPKK